MFSSLWYARWNQWMQPTSTMYLTNVTPTTHGSRISTSTPQLFTTSSYIRRITNSSGVRVGSSVICSFRFGSVLLMYARRNTSNSCSYGSHHQELIVLNRMRPKVGTPVEGVRNKTTPARPQSHAQSTRPDAEYPDIHLFPNPSTLQCDAPRTTRLF